MRWLRAGATLPTPPSTPATTAARGTDAATATLTLRGVTDDDAGAYSCSAVSETGETTWPFTIDVDGKWVRGSFQICS